MLRVPGGIQNAVSESLKVQGNMCVCEGELGILQLRVGESAEVGLPHCRLQWNLSSGHRVFRSTCCRSVSLDPGGEDRHHLERSTGEKETCQTGLEKSTYQSIYCLCSKLLP